MGALVELDLRTPLDKPEAEPSVWKSLAQNVLRVILEATTETDSQDTRTLRVELGEFRQTLARDLHPQEQRGAAAECVKTCERYLQALEKDQRNRESELLDMVTILRQAALRFIGDSSDFTARLESSADRFRMMTRLDDIRDLKAQLTSEVDSLNRVVEQKRSRDAEMVNSLSKKVVALETDLKKAAEEASTDALTRLPNRGAFDRALREMVDTASQANRALTLAMVDVDHFKLINDTHGHQVGDRVLLCTGQWLRNAVRNTDFVARFGGEEFAALLSGADLRVAEARMTQVVKDIASRSYEYDVDGDARSIRFTVSCGATQFTPGDTVEQFVERADQALYEAKQKGRNRVVARKPSRFARLLSLK